MSPDESVPNKGSAPSSAVAPGEQPLSGPLPPGAAVKFRFSRADGFREIPADGLWFSIGPQKQVHLSAYTDKFSLPEEVKLEIDKSGTVLTQTVLKQETEWLQKEFSVDIIMTYEAVTSFYHLLGNNLKVVNEALSKK